MKKTKTIREKLFLSITLVFLLIGCQAKATLNLLPFGRMMIAQDLPVGWSQTESTWKTLHGTQAFIAEFRIKNDPQKYNFVISHSVALYSDEKAAGRAYPDWEKEIFPTSEWIEPSDHIFEPKDAHDQYRLGCMDITLDGQPIKSCNFLQKHGYLISSVHATLDGKMINLDLFINALEIVDLRFQQHLR